MDAAENHRYLNDPAWRRWTLLVALLALGSAYVFAYVLFIMRSADYIVAKRNQQAWDYSRGHIIDLPAVLSIGLGKPDVARLGGGWHFPELDGVWSAENDAWIHLVVHTGNDSDLQLRLNTKAFVAKRHPAIRVSISVNETPLGSFKRDHANATEPLEVRVSRSATRSGELSIHLRIDESASPADVGIGPDRRQLGVSLSSIELRETP